MKLGLFVALSLVIAWTLAVAAICDCGIPCDPTYVHWFANNGDGRDRLAALRRVVHGSHLPFSVSAHRLDLLPQCTQETRCNQTTQR